MSTTAAYAELQVTSNYSFLRGASHPEELVARAAALEYRAIAITDRNSVAGVVRAHLAARDAGIKLLPGARLDLADGNSLICLPTDRQAWGRLTTLLTLGRRRAAKGDCQLVADDLGVLGSGQVVIVPPPAGAFPDDGATVRQWERFRAHAEAMVARFPGACLAVQWLYSGADTARLDRIENLAARLRMPLVATNDVHYHHPARRPLQEVLTCIREGITLEEAGFRQFANAERHLRPVPEIKRLFAAWPGAVARSAEIAETVSFSLDALRYEYPAEPMPGGGTPDEELARRVREGARERYPGGMPADLQQTVRRELELVAEFDYARYFLTVHDIVIFARSRGILCQGRGSAANSAICYCLGITAVDPTQLELLFERFISRERNEPPDIDVDFEHERREEVIQHIYERYGRDRAGLAATVVSYRSRSAIREVGKVFGLAVDVLDGLATATRLRRETPFDPAGFREMGLDPGADRIARVLQLARELRGFPRHLSQHPGGFVITRGPLHELCPITNAAMADRTVVEWDKDDLEALGILKIDVLGLGMLTCIRKAFGLIAGHYGKPLTLATLPADDPAVYDMLCVADAVGVFQVESRAQMAMLPRLRPRRFYDLVIEVAIVRPGPIQGDMVHPYLRRRNGEEAVSYPSAELKAVLDKTLGVPLFQEQAMKIAIVASGFSPGDADRLRRAMTASRRRDAIEAFRDRFVSGMTERGYDRGFAERCFRQIEGFGDYGFPESHAASFALLVYASAWIKRHYPAAFACALLNSQPMGFYAPAQILRDAREHGVEVRPVDVNASEQDCTLEPAMDGSWALRLGFRCVRGFAVAHAERLVAGRGNGYPDPLSLYRRAELPRAVLERLAESDAFASMGLNRREALWALRRLPERSPEPSALFGWTLDEEEEGEADRAFLPPATEGEEVTGDYASLGLSLRNHPLALLREAPGGAGERLSPTIRARALAGMRDGTRVEVAGLVLARQRPGTASGVLFMTLEDESGATNIIVWPRVLERFRRQAIASKMVAVRGQLQREGIVIHVIADRIEDLSHLLDGLGAPGGKWRGRRRGRIRPKSRDFH